MENIYIFFEDFKNGKFKVRNGKKLENNIDLISNHIHYYDAKKFCEEKYELGYGIKSIIKDFHLKINYSVLRNFLIKFTDIKIRKNNDITDILRKKRSNKAIYEKKNNIGAFSVETQQKIKNSKYTSRGIQGYYFNKSKLKYVWLRSSWEYIYAKWLDKTNHIWDVECVTYNLDNNITYRPDFFIYDKNNILTDIVEIKGYWKNKTYKYDELKQKIKNVRFSLITEIKPYAEKNIKKEIEEWKILKTK